MKAGFLLLVLAAGCEATLPADVEDYATRCVKMNPTPFPPYEGDPHHGMKTVYACNVDRSLLEANTRPFRDGTVIVKQSIRPPETTPWLVATARKHDRGWHWDEYTRNFPDEELRRNLAGQGVCTGCHQHAREADWIFTQFSAP